MAKSDVKPGVSAELYRRMMAVKPASLSERQWCLDGKVSTSFFTDLRKGREPGIDKVERMANAIRLSLSDLVDGVEMPSPAPVPSEAQIVAMVQIAVDQGVNLGTRLADLPHIVAPVLREQLELYQSGGAAPNHPEQTSALDTDAQSPPPTKRPERAAQRKP